MLVIPELAASKNFFSFWKGSFIGDPENARTVKGFIFLAGFPMKFCTKF